MHGTGAFTRSIVPARRRLRSSRSRVAQLRRRRAARHHRARRRQHDRHRRRRVRQADPARPRRRARTGGTSRACVVITSSGVMWSEETKQGLLEHHPGMMLVDAFSSSEALGMGQSVSTAGGAADTAKFTLGENARVITDDGRDVDARLGRDRPGRGQGPARRSATTRTRRSRRPRSSSSTASATRSPATTPRSRPTARSRCSAAARCASTPAARRSSPKRSRRSLKTHPTVRDAVAVGVPDEKFGEAITAVVEPRPARRSTRPTLIAHVKSRLAAYKAPKRVLADRHDRPRPQRQGRLQAPEAVRRRHVVRRRLTRHDRSGA